MHAYKEVLCGRQRLLTYELLWEQHVKCLLVSRKQQAHKMSLQHAPGDQHRTAFQESRFAHSEDASGATWCQIMQAQQGPEALVDDG
jgi:hypothetical protein